MTFDPRDIIWNSTFDTYYDCYFEEMVADKLLYRWCLLDDINKWLIALTASGSAVSGWALWDKPELNLIWIILSSLSAFLAITHSSLGVQQKIKSWEVSKKAFVDLRIEFEWLRQDISIHPDFDIPEVEQRLNSLRQRYSENMSRLSPDTLRTRKLDSSIQTKLNDTIANQIEE
jgi:hypothetical protein